ncbi:Nramp family divalent metal transporter [Edaphobacter modestus]|uniref:NRAMP (Natural resistance-associated macrophage protein)-like metal ion transporter n=1 Tax=Edaphobacter modestus TaxID=388466 RepID=A0A4Q7YQA7_9BACT|nr:Nramp family divalent metal transporter [Edaphobacter modestus]RZU39650.1 NRAMP (natural resistance-associated macrophage protein)-like metal ion transporter [Edaphobacter modestus]
MTLWRRWRNRLMLLFAVLGPGFITANVDNDSGGILTYSQAGAQYGYKLLWTMIPITLALIVVQEMCARMGVVTGKGLSDLIREEFGLRITFFVMILLVIVNFGNVMAEFSGIAGSMQLFHVSKYISVPISAFIVWILVVKGDYKSVEKVFLAASVVYIAYIFTGVLSGPNWHEALVQTVKLPGRSVWNDRNYVYMTIGIIGTTITPWMQFYLQSSIVEKGIEIRQYKHSRLDVIVGSIFTDVVAWFIIVACAATLYTHGMRNIGEASDAADAMKPLAGQYAFILFAAGLFNASLFAACILPLSTAYTVCEGLGLESGLDKGFKEARFFYSFYTLLLALGAAVVLIPNFPLIRVIIGSQVLNGVLLPVVLIFMLRLINKHELMGKYTNSRWFNVVAWLTAAIVICLSLVLMWNGIHGGS